ncbi:MAG: rhodanese-like domain protein [Ferruginibacter sp.]|nr:rhodanese-like domain protein [Ferruginibacter sp.]
MKKTFFLASAVILFAACNNSSEKNSAATAEKVEVAGTDGTAYSIDSSALVTWTGSKPTGKHSGTFTLSEGTLFVKDNNLTGGSFLINIASLTNQDLAGDAENKGKLEGHLKSPDFFDVAKYPTAKFEITSVEPSISDSSKKTGATHLIKGNLTLKDSTKNVSFPATITIDANTVSATADFSIDRTQWGMNYKGPNNPQDWFISKEVGIKLAITAHKK